MRDTAESRDGADDQVNNATAEKRWLVAMTSRRGEWMRRVPTHKMSESSIAAIAEGDARLNM